MRTQQMRSGEVGVEEGQKWFVAGVDLNAIIVGEQHY